MVEGFIKKQQEIFKVAAVLLVRLWRYMKFRKKLLMCDERLVHLILDGII